MGGSGVQVGGAEAAGRAAPGSLTIGELATCTGVTPETIRYYEREEVIPRAERSGAGQYRRYGAGDAERLRFVRRARDLGFSLDEVRELLDLATGEHGGSCAEVNRLARGHLAQVDAKLAQLAALRAELNGLVQGCERGGAVAGCGLLSALSGAADAP
jgi:DNA-binding transcriptional MerR regulator